MKSAASLMCSASNCSMHSLSCTPLSWITWCVWRRTFLSLMRMAITNLGHTTTPTRPLMPSWRILNLCLAWRMHSWRASCRPLNIFHVPLTSVSVSHLLDCLIKPNPIIDLLSIWLLMVGDSCLLPRLVDVLGNNRTLSRSPKARRSVLAERSRIRLQYPGHLDMLYYTFARLPTNCTVVPKHFPYIGTAVWGLMKLVQLHWKSFFNKKLPYLMVYVHKNHCQLFHMSNGIIWLTNWITLVHLNSFRPINLLLHLICLSFKNTLYIINSLSGVLEVSWGPEILT